MLMAFRLLEANPAEPLPALCALNLAASFLSMFHGDWSITFLVWAGFGTIFEVNVIESFLHEFVLFSDLPHLIPILGEQINAIDIAPLARVYSILAVKTKCMFTVLTFACVFVFLNNCNSSTSRQGAPTHIIHLINGVMNTLCLIFLQHCLVKAYILDVLVIQCSLTVLNSALYPTNIT